MLKKRSALKKLAVAANKLLIDSQKLAMEQRKYNELSKANIFKVYNEIEKNQILGTGEIAKIEDKRR